MRHGDFVRLGAVMAAAALVMSGFPLSCSMMAGEDWFSEGRSGNDGPGDVVTDDEALDLSPYLPAPAAGATAVFSFAADSFVGVLQWADADGAALSAFFQTETAYTATASLYAAADYSFAEVKAFRYGEEALVVLPGRTDRQVTVEIPFPETGNTPWAEATEPEEVSDLDLAPYLPAPATGATPTLSFAAVGYVGIVDWTDSGGAAGALFQNETRYYAAVTLYPTALFIFPDDAVFTHAAHQVDHKARSPVKVALTITFPAAGEPEEIHGLDLAPYLPAPAAGAPPELSFAAEKFVGTVTWTDATGASVVGTFGTGTAYRAAAILYALTGAVFSTDLNFTHSESTTPDAPITATGMGEKVALAAIGFAPTGEAAETPETPVQVTGVDLDLTLLLPAPVADKKPVVAAAAEGYVVIAAWSETKGGAELSGPFLDDTAYTAEAILYPRALYTFYGIPATPETPDGSSEGCFFHKGQKTTVTHKAGAADEPLKVSISFPASFKMPITFQW